MKKVKLSEIVGLSAKLLLLTFLLGAFQVSAQEKEKRQEKIKNLKIAYFTEELNLTSAESEKFWPVYNEMEEKIKNLRKENRQQVEKLDFESETLKDEDYKKAVNAMLDNEIEEAGIKKEYFGKLAGVIGNKKAAKTFKLEKEFKEKLLRELKERPGGAGPPRQKPNR